MPQRDITTYNSLISGFALGGRAPDALTLFHRLPTINDVTIVAALSACAQLGSLQEATTIHDAARSAHLDTHIRGSMHIKSFDWVDPIRSGEPLPSSQFRLARLVVDSDFTAPCDTSILYPTSGGNIHTFTAITPCAVLDILGPPYSKEEERDCTYYEDHPNCHFQDGAAMISERHDEGLRWLEEIDIPKSLKMNRKEYRGPRIFDC